MNAAMKSANNTVGTPNTMIRSHRRNRRFGGVGELGTCTNSSCLWSMAPHKVRFVSRSVFNVADRLDGRPPQLTRRAR